MEVDTCGGRFSAGKGGVGRPTLNGGRGNGDLGRGRNVEHPTPNVERPMGEAGRGIQEGEGTSNAQHRTSNVQWGKRERTSNIERPTSNGGSGSEHRTPNAQGESGSERPTPNVRPPAPDSRLPASEFWLLSPNVPWEKGTWRVNRLLRFPAFCLLCTFVSVRQQRHPPCGVVPHAARLHRGVRGDMSPRRGSGLAP